MKFIEITTFKLNLKKDIKTSQKKVLKLPKLSFFFPFDIMTLNLYIFFSLFFFNPMYNFNFGRYKISLYVHINHNSHNTFPFMLVIK